jgi:phosphate-selective porin OprO/OprP
MKEPYGLEESTADPFVTFLERNAPNEAFSPAFNTGFLLTDTCWSDRATWAAGAFREAAGNGNDVDNERSGEWNFTGRLAGRPWIGDEPDSYLHLGGAVSLRDPSDGIVVFASRPELHLVAPLVDTGPLATDGVRLFELEAAIVHGPLWAAVEFHRAEVSGRAGERDSSLDGLAAQAGWFLTGESRPYDAQRGAFDRVTPRSSYGEPGGLGAWEIALRWDELDLDDGAASGGRMQIRTVALNWHLNPNTKFAFGWVHARVVRLGEIDGFEARFQVDF